MIRRNGRLHPSLPVLVCLLLVGAPATAEPLEMAEVAPGVFVHQGVHEESGTENSGDIANVAFVVGADAVAVIDSGGSPDLGRRLLEAVRATTDLPVRHLVNTHMHPDHVLGNAVFREAGAEVVGHAGLADALARRWPTYRSRAAAWAPDLPEDPDLFLPTVPVKDSLRLDLGGRILVLTAHPTAHTNNDLTVLDERTGTLFAGDLLFIERHPSLDGSILGWQRVLDGLAALPATRVVPGHGPVAPWPAAAEPLRTYLEAVITGLRRLLEDQVGLALAVERVTPEEKTRWRLWQSYHPQLVTAAFAELEWE